MELAVTKLAIICFFITGVSHIVQPRVWAQFFIDMHSKGKSAVSKMRCFIFLWVFSLSPSITCGMVCRLSLR